MNKLIKNALSTLEDEINALESSQENLLDQVYNLEQDKENLLNIVDKLKGRISELEEALAESYLTSNKDKDG